MLIVLGLVMTYLSLSADRLDGCCVGDDELFLLGTEMMRYVLIFSVWMMLVLSSMAWADARAATASATPRVGLSIIKTSQVAVREALLVPGGSLFKEIDSNFSAFLIKHGEQYLLFDTGLGGKIDQQYQQDMKFWQRPFFKYDKPINPARAQLDKAGIAPIGQVIISHSHWDHAGGVLDFPEAKISVAAPELAVIRQPTTGAGGTWASQVASNTIRWDALVFKPIAYKGYTHSLDLFNDGSVVLVPMNGHTAGSIGMFVTVDSGTCYFLIGDVAWTVAALKSGAPKFWAASLIVDDDADQTQASLLQVRELMKKEPKIVVLPAHDGVVQKDLGYFPAWVK